MTLTAFLLIVASASLHASWNLVAKKNHMTIPFYTLMCLPCFLLWGHLSFWSPVSFPAAPWEFWFFLICSIFSDLLYCTFLVLSYSRMEMTTAYPIMRSLPIIFTALATFIFGIGDKLTWLNCVGFLIVFAGALLMPLNHFSDFKLSQYMNSSMLFIILTALGTTGYTIFDKLALGYLTASNPTVGKVMCSTTYYSIRDIFLFSELMIVIALTKNNRQAFKEIIASHNWHPLLAGAFASLTYILVLIAMNYVSNVAYVQVFRQLGLPAGMILGILILKEHSTMTKWTGVALILLGLAVSVIKV